MAKIQTPVKGFSGRVVGVDFVDGEGETDNEAALAYFERKGYTVAGSAEDSGEEDETIVEVVDPLGTLVEANDLGSERDAADPRNDAIPVGGVKGDGTIVAGKGKGKRVSKDTPAPAPEPGSVVAGVQETGDPTNQSANPSSPNPPEAVTPVDDPTPIDETVGDDLPSHEAPESGDLKADTSADVKGA